MQKPFILLGSIIIILASMVLVLQMQVSNLPDRGHQVYNVCMAAHGDTDGKHEAACGAMQDKYHYEFLCDKTGASCWVESK
jgi:hypothetical protein